MCLLSAAAQAAVLTLLQFTLLTDADLPAAGDSAVSAALTGVAGAALYVASYHFFAWERAWRERRRKRLRLDT